MNSQELIEALKKYQLSEEEQNNSCGSNFAAVLAEQWIGPTFEHPVFGKITIVEDYCGEDMGSTRYIVAKFHDHEDTIVRWDGWYASYEGSNWDDAEPYQVFEKTKTITVYEK